jgi:hypothetical protein
MGQEWWGQFIEIEYAWNRTACVREMAASAHGALADLISGEFMRALHKFLTKEASRCN